MIISIIAALLLSSSFAMPTVLSAQVDDVNIYSLTVEQQVDIYFSDIPEMKEVARCESEFRQFDSWGSVLRGEVNDDDVGVMQINEYYHSKTADKMEIDLHTITGNMKYARYLYEKEGTRPWKSSKPCWGDKIASL